MFIECWTDALWKTRVMFDDFGVQHFNAGEVIKASAGFPTNPYAYRNILPTVHYADLLREEFGPTRVTSGYRSAPYNARVGGAVGSYHVKFNALDLQPAEGDPRLWAEFMRHIGQHHAGGLGTYHEKGFIHIDTRFLVFGAQPTEW